MQNNNRGNKLLGAVSSSYFKCLLKSVSILARILFTNNCCNACVAEFCRSKDIWKRKFCSPRNSYRPHRSCYLACYSSWANSEFNFLDVTAVEHWTTDIKCQPLFYPHQNLLMRLKGFWMLHCSLALFVCGHQKRIVPSKWHASLSRCTSIWLKMVTLPYFDIEWFSGMEKICSTWSKGSFNEQLDCRC